MWQAIGYYMVMHVASIDGISQEVYEAASIDGATGVQKFFKITIPLLRRSIGTTYIPVSYTHLRQARRVSGWILIFSR